VSPGPLTLCTGRAINPKTYPNLQLPLAEPLPASSLLSNNLFLFLFFLTHSELKPLSYFTYEKYNFRFFFYSRSDFFSFLFWTSSEKAQEILFFKRFMVLDVHSSIQYNIQAIKPYNLWPVDRGSYIELMAPAGFCIEKVISEMGP
jgi:hypothetical protein